MTCDPQEVARLVAPGEYSLTVASREEATEYTRQAFFDWEEVAEATGEPYPKAAAIRWFQIHPAEDIVRNEDGQSLPHVKYEDWTGGKKGGGGNWGHIFFPVSQPRKEQNPL